MGAVECEEEVVAGVSAATGCVVPLALLQHIAVAADVGEVAVRAAVEAAVRDGSVRADLVLAHGKVVALVLALNERADALACLEVGVPLADGVIRASTLGGVLEVALERAAVVVGVVQLAHIGSLAGALVSGVAGVEAALCQSASGLTFGRGVVVHALGVVVAAGSLRVAEAARSLAQVHRRVVRQV